MKKLFSAVYRTATVIFLALPVGTIHAAGDLTRQTPIVIEVEVGAEDGVKWIPDEFTLETGKLYQFIFKNSSEFRVDVEAPALIQRIFTRKVQSYALENGEMQRTAEVKGVISAFEVFAGQQVDWWFVPLQTTRRPIKVCCTTEDDAVAATITIE